MASETEKLMVNCIESTAKLKFASDACGEAIGEFKVAAQAVDDARPNDFDKTLKAAMKKDEKAKKAIEALTKAFKSCEKETSPLNKKVMLKNVLSLFKTQKTLDDAKVVLKNANDMLKDSTTNLRKFKTDYQKYVKQIKDTENPLNRTN